MAPVGRWTLGLIVMLAMSLPAIAEDENADAAAAIRSVLVAQGEAWNRGDLSGYMDSFARNERTRHIFNRDITVGYSAIEARFQSRYPDPSNMGTISHSDLDVTVLAPDAAFAFAHWSFEHEGKTFAGVFTLIFRHLDGRWVIVHDHSTAFPGDVAGAPMVGLVNGRGYRLVDDLAQAFSFGQPDPPRPVVVFPGK